MFPKGRWINLDNGGNKRPVGIGTGYLSIMMIFVVLCLTMLAALSYSAASSEKNYSDRSGEYTKEYYSADLEAKRKLAEIDAAAANYDDPADFMFIAELEEIEGAEVRQLPDGVEVRWSTPINERQSICSAVKYSGSGYIITEWQTVFSYEAENKPLNVWSGE